MDGCSDLGIWWHVMIPATRPALVTLGIFVFIGTWGEISLAPDFAGSSRAIYVAPGGGPTGGQLFPRLAHGGSGIYPLGFASHSRVCFANRDLLYLLKPVAE